MFSSAFHYDIQISSLTALNRSPEARAEIRGGVDFPNILGFVRFYSTDRGVMVRAEIQGLPTEKDPCRNRIFGFHIHSGHACEGTAEDPFADTLGHDNPMNCQHPHHAGDLPPLFENDGMAVMAVLTNRFQIENIIGKTVVIHEMPDDFRTDPSGNSGTKIACGVIRSLKQPA